MKTRDEVLLQLLHIMVEQYDGPSLMSVYARSSNRRPGMLRPVPIQQALEDAVELAAAMDAIVKRRLEAQRAPTTWLTWSTDLPEEAQQEIRKIMEEQLREEPCSPQ
jgi:hypothetical protein